MMRNFTVCGLAKQNSYNNVGEKNLGGKCSMCIGQNKISHSLAEGNPEKISTLRKLTRRLEDNIKMDLKGTELEIVDWLKLVQDMCH
jgi:hypothetical protein